MKKKGFTLIELLAVIIILAVIALIATPVVLNIVDTAKEKANKNSAYGLVDAARLYYSESLLDGSNSGIDGKTNLFSEIKVSGDKPENGTLYIKGNGEIALAVVYDEVCYKKEFIDTDLSEIEDTENCSVTANEGGSVVPDKPEVSYKCIRATTLHTEECTQTSTSEYCSGAGYTASGSKGTTTITYGNLGTSGVEPVSGDAFDCVVNIDKNGNKQVERFYYVTDFTTEDNKDYAVLIYSNNTTEGIADNTSTSLVAYDSSNKNYQGPVTAIANLPTETQWNNIRLSNINRAITNENGGASTDSGTLPTTFSYTKIVDGETVPLAARLLTSQEIATACGITVGGARKGELDKCNYLMENTKYSGGSVNPLGFWLETPCDGRVNYAWSLYTDKRIVFSNITIHEGSYGVRPVIEVLKSEIQF